MDIIKPEITDRNTPQDTEKILELGLSAQQKMAEFSTKVLANVKNRDLGEVGDMISALVGRISADEHGFLSKLKKPANKLYAIKSNFEKTEKTVETITAQLEEKLFDLHKDIALFEQMYQINAENLKELEECIARGNEKIKEVKDSLLLLERTDAQPSAYDVQRIQDKQKLLNRLEKRVYDLELSRAVGLQTAPQIRLIQHNDWLLAEKIRSVICNTIPLWKGQMVIALGLEHSRLCEDSYREICDMTNGLLVKNAESLKTATLDTEKASQRGIIDIETLEKVNNLLTEGFSELAQLQKEGKEKRNSAKETLLRLEGELLKLK